MTAAGLDWQTLGDKKRQENIAKTPKEWLLDQDYLASLHVDAKHATNVIELDVCRSSGRLSEAELEITERYTATELLAALAAGKLTSVDVATAFCKRAAIAQQLLSCLTEVHYAQALDRAAMLDEYYRKEGKTIGPLHGLPISIKDSFRLKGLHSTVGYSALLDRPVHDSNSPLVQMLLDAGAVLYVKTNVPQTMMTADSENNIFGRTLNPHNTSLTAGGSSGGEGSLVSFRGSILGVGTDIAGSIRIPALCCGVYGFKPTSDRVPFGGQISGAMEGLPGPTPAAGPLAHSLDDVELFLRTIWNGKPADYDSTAQAGPFLPDTTLAQKKKLRIGVLNEEKVFPLHPPIRRAMANAVKALSEAGHEIIKLDEDPATSVALGNLIPFSYYILGPNPADRYLGPHGEPPVQSVSNKHNPLFCGHLPVSPELEPFQKIDELHIVRHAYEEAWRKRWVNNRLDILISPGAQNTAVPHDTYGWPPYTQIWNILDYPACVIPYGKASKVADAEPSSSLGDEFGPQPPYEPDAVDGAPCAIQVVARKHYDELCLAGAKIIDQILRTSQLP